MAFVAIGGAWGLVALVLNGLFLRDARTDMLPIRMWQDLEGKLDVTIAALSGGVPIIGPGRPIDTDRYYVVMVDPLGNCSSNV